MAGNRAARRAAAPKRRRPKLEGIQLTLSIDDVRLLEEALHTYRQGLVEVLGRPEGNPDYNLQQRWAYDRAEHLRRQMDAALTGYTYKPPPLREPGGLEVQRIQRLLSSE